MTAVIVMTLIIVLNSIFILRHIVIMLIILANRMLATGLNHALSPLHSSFREVPVAGPGFRGRHLDGFQKKNVTTQRLRGA